MIDLKRLTTTQLRAIRQILVSGDIATSAMESKAGRAARKYKAEAEALKKEKKYREIVESFDLEWDDPAYYLSFSEAGLVTTCSKLADARKQAAIAEITKSVPFKIPALRVERENESDTPYSIARDFLRSKRNGGGS